MAVIRLLTLDDKWHCKKLKECVKSFYTDKLWTIDFALHQKEQIFNKELSLIIISEHKDLKWTFTGARPALGECQPAHYVIISGLKIHK